MDQQSPKMPSFNLPQGRPDMAGYYPQATATAPEQLPMVEVGSGAEMMPAPSPIMPPVPQIPPMPMQHPAQAVAMPMPAPATIPTTALPAGSDDDDLDKEWVNKAKAIVEQTRTDPFTQSRELSKFKANYLKARHGKEVKIAEE